MYECLNARALSLVDAGGHVPLVGDELPYLAERINRMFFLKLIHPHTRQLNFTIPCYRIELTGLWVN